MASMKRYYNPGTGQLEYMPGFDDNSPLTVTEKLLEDGIKKNPLPQEVLNTELNLPKIKKTPIGYVKTIPKEKPTYPFDTPQGIDHVTRVLKEEAPDKLSSKEEANLNILNKEMKLSVLKDEIGGVKKYNQYDRTSFPSDPEQSRRLKNIDKLEKSLGYTSPELNVPYNKDTRAPVQKKRDNWEANKRTVQQLQSLKEWGQNPLTKTNYSKGGGVKKKFDLWNDGIKTDKSPQNIAEVRKLVNDHVKSVGHTKLLTPDEFKYLDKKEEPKPLAVVHDEALDVLAERPTGPEPVPEKPVAQIIKEMADARLLAEQRDWDYRWGQGGIPRLKRPE